MPCLLVNWFYSRWFVGLIEIHHGNAKAYQQLRSHAVPLFSHFPRSTLTACRVYLGMSHGDAWGITADRMILGESSTLNETAGHRVASQRPTKVIDAMCVGYRWIPMCFNNALAFHYRVTQACPTSVVEIPLPRLVEWPRDRN